MYDYQVLHLKLGTFEYDDDELEETLGKRNFVMATHKNGDRFLGQWLDGTTIRHGTGILLQNHHAIYEGYWNNGLSHGKGRDVFHGGIYVGNYENGKRSGYGKSRANKALTD